MSIELISGSQLKILLKRRSIKISELVDAFDFNRITISRYFNDHVPMPADFIIKVAKFAGLSLDQLLEGQFESSVTETTHTDVAAEPEIEYVQEPAPAPEPPPEPTHPVIIIDTSGLEHKLSDLYHKIEDIQHEIEDIKKELELVNH